MTPLQVYLLITIPKFGQAFTVFFGVLAGICFLGAFFGAMDAYEFPYLNKKWRFLFTAGITTGIISILLGTLFPTAKELVAIYAIPAVVNNQQVQQIPEKLLEYANLTLDDLIQDKAKEVKND